MNDFLLIGCIGEQAFIKKSDRVYSLSPVSKIIDGGINCFKFSGIMIWEYLDEFMYVEERIIRKN